MGFVTKSENIYKGIYKEQSYIYNLTGAGCKPN